jgi:hypothetical protein
MNMLLRWTITAVNIFLVWATVKDHAIGEHLHGRAVSPFVEFVTWDFKDYDLPDSDFRLDFRTNITIVKIDGFVSGTTLPGEPPTKTPGYVRQILLICTTPQGPEERMHLPAIGKNRLNNTIL